MERIHSQMVDFELCSVQMVDFKLCSVEMVDFELYSGYLTDRPIPTFTMLHVHVSSHNKVFHYMKHCNAWKGLV